MAFELITVLIVLAAILVALRPGVLLNSVYAFAEIMNMQSIRESLDNEDPASTNTISNSPMSPTTIII